MMEAATKDELWNIFESGSENRHVASTSENKGIYGKDFIFISDLGTLKWMKKRFPVFKSTYSGKEYFEPSTEDELVSF